MVLPEADDDAARREDCDDLNSEASEYLHRRVDSANHQALEALEFRAT
jgi:hypothetical protein